MATKSQKGRKIGRNRARPAQKVYTAAQRWVTNKAKCMKRHTRRMAKKAIHRIEWEIRIKRTTLQANADRLQQLRHVVSQNLTG
jgi:hypothetical protein